MQMFDFLKNRGYTICGEPPPASQCAPTRTQMLTGTSAGECKPVTEARLQSSHRAMIAAEIRSRLAHGVGRGSLQIEAGEDDNVIDGTYRELDGVKLSRRK